MKQHISSKQLNELSEKGKKAYFKWCADRGLMTRNPAGIWPVIEPIKTKNWHCLSIGQMIEFLDEHWSDPEINHIGEEEWYVANPADDRKEYQEGELCDALFEAMKEVLEA